VRYTGPPGWVLGQRASTPSPGKNTHSKKELKWVPKQRRARGRPKEDWIVGIRKAMNERILSESQ